MLSRDNYGIAMVQVTVDKSEVWVYRDSLSDAGKLLADVFEEKANLKAKLATLEDDLKTMEKPSGVMVPVEALPERHRPKYIKGVDIMDPDERDAADPVWIMMSFLRLLEEHRNLKDYFAISPGELQEAMLRFQETDTVMKEVSLERYNGEELNKTGKRKFQPGRPLTLHQLDSIKKMARNYVPAIDMKVPRGRKYDRPPRPLGGLKVVETAASSTRSFIKNEDEFEEPDDDFDDDYEGDQSEAEEAPPRFKRAKTLKSATFDSRHF